MSKLRRLIAEGRGDEGATCARRPLIIAEIGVNHEGCMKTAFQLIDDATDAGADAVKFQTYKAEKLASRDSLQPIGTLRSKRVTPNLSSSKNTMASRLKTTKN